jgi:hypothetical protein
LITSKNRTTGPKNRSPLLLSRRARTLPLVVEPVA